MSSMQRFKKLVAVSFLHEINPNHPELKKNGISAANTKFLDLRKEISEIIRKTSTRSSAQRKELMKFYSIVEKEVDKNAKNETIETPNTN